MTKQKVLPPDAVLKSYWRNNDRFADLFNQIFFNGEALISPEDLSDAATDEADMLLEGETVTAISRLRDLFKRYGSQIVLALFNVENQMSIHYAMPVRFMQNDALDYTKQCKAIEQEHRRQNDLKSGAEFLSGMTADDRIAPILSLLIYYGEEPWDGPNNLWDIMDIPDAMKPYINDYHIHVFQVKDSLQYSFQNQDNRDFFMLISEFYNQKGRFKISEFREKHPDMDVYWETVAAVGAATGTTKLMKYALKNEGKRLNMCTALQGLIDDGIAQGRKTGREEGIKTGRQKERDEIIAETVRHLKGMNIPAPVFSALAESFHLSEEELHKYLS